MTDHEEKLQMKEVPSNEAPGSQAGGADEDPERRDSNDANLKPNSRDVPFCDKIFNAYNDYYWLGVITYFLFYCMYYFQIIVLILFVSETGWFDADFCSQVSEDADEDACINNNGQLCDWNVFTNENGVRSDYCDASSMYTIYQILLLFYFGIIIIFWEGLSLLSCFSTIGSMDRISKTPPKANVTPFGLTKYGDSSDDKLNNNNNNNNSHHNHHSGNSLHFRLRYIWAYNVFLPFKWIVEIGIFKQFKSFESFNYSLLASRSLDKTNIGLEIGCKVIINCVFAIWWINMNESSREIDNVTLCLFISAALTIFQNCYELIIIQTYKRNVYVLSSKI